MLGFLSKLFGSKSERDIKLIMPIVEQIKAEYAKLSALSHDELRQKTIEFKARIQSHLADIDKQIADLKVEAEAPDL
ncbi:MAG TPA: hypothetical protein VGE15_00070, partial [Sphingobacteriaceae bacterium]